MSVILVISTPIKHATPVSLEPYDCDTKSNSPPNAFPALKKIEKVAFALCLIMSWSKKWIFVATSASKNFNILLIDN